MTKRLKKTVLQPLIVFVLMFTLANTAQASILSLFNVFFHAEAATVDNSATDNSQKMALLEAPVNSQTVMSDVPEVNIDNGALVPDLSPTGSAQSNAISTYKVVSGDTVSAIAQKFNISANTIIWANNLKRSDSLTIGQTLVILPISGVQYKIVSGDTIQSIAAKYGGDVNEIIDFNGIDPAKIKVGDTIVIPDGEGSVSGGASSPSTRSGSGKTKKYSFAIRKDVDPSYYSRPILAGVKTQGIHGYNAVDLADSCGTPIYSSAAGTVIVSKDNGAWNGGYGNYVVLSHDNGSQTLYAHMEKTLVNVGDTVGKMQIIGKIGHTGKVSGVTGCHVHFEIRNGPLNPF